MNFTNNDSPFSKPITKSLLNSISSNCIVFLIEFSSLDQAKLNSTHCPAEVITQSLLMCESNWKPAWAVTSLFLNVSKLLISLPLKNTKDEKRKSNILPKLKLVK